MKENDIEMIEFTKSISGVHEIDMLAIYNTKNISEEEVVVAIEEDTEHKNIIFVTKEQFNNVFSV